MTPRDLGRSLTHRVRNHASDQGIDPQRLRRMLVFQRVLVRLAEADGWVLKGGFSLEVRLALRARATKDLDLAQTGSIRTADDLQELLVEALTPDPQVDGFTFRVLRPRAISSDEAGNPGWRTSVQALVGNEPFETIKVDVVTRPDEIDGGTELLTVPPPVPAVGHEAVMVQAVNVAQHAAEKLHAFCRVYAHDRPSSRMKDLVDLVLLIESGVLVVDELAARLVHVFAIRDRTRPPAELPVPPTSWQVPFGAMAAELALTSADLDTAHALVDNHYAQAVQAAATEGHR